MKKGTTQLSKFKLLAKRLMLPDWQVVGLLESVWMFAQSETPAGDVGSKTDEAIAIQVGIEASEWRRVRDAMIAEGWLDPDSGCRFVIHDFEHHAPEWTKKQLQRAGMRFVTPDGGGEFGSLVSAARRTTADNGRQRQPLSDHGQPPSNHGQTTADHGSPTQPNPTQPNPTPPSPNPTQPSARTPSRTAGEEEVFKQLRKKPDWLKDDQGWIDLKRADELARLPTTTPEVVACCLAEVRAARSGLKDPAGLFVKKVRAPNMEAVRELTERNARIKARLNGAQ